MWYFDGGDFVDGGEGAIVIVDFWVENVDLVLEDEFVEVDLDFEWLKQLLLFVIFL